MTDTPSDEIERLRADCKMFEEAGFDENQINKDLRRRAETAEAVVAAAQIVADRWKPVTAHGRLKLTYEQLNPLCEALSAYDKAIESPMDEIHRLGQEYDKDRPDE